MRSDGKDAVGVVGVSGEGGPLASDVVQTLDAMLDQAAVAVERSDFARKVAETEALAASERFRAALLSSISHDLRTPLTSILGSITVLRQHPAQFGEEARADLLATIEEEAERLDCYVLNLLDITWLEAGAVKPKRQWLYPAEIVDTAVRRVGDTGLRRSICKGATEAMGGTIEAISPAVGARGMRFTLRFPLEKQPAALESSEIRR